jgi:hypothetical protein
MREDDDRYLCESKYLAADSVIRIVGRNNTVTRRYFVARRYFVSSATVAAMCVPRHCVPDGILSGCDRRGGVRPLIR